MGKITEGRAYLSSNKKSVYSEFTVEIEKQFKNLLSENLTDDKYLKFEREGGVVVYATGYETFYFVAGQGIPKVGQKYVFFLSNRFPLYGVKKEIYI